MNQSTKLISPVALMIATCASAQFSGDDAPETWTVTGAGIGGSSATFALNGTSLTIIGSDGGFAGDTDVTHAVLAGGIWTFSWSYSSTNFSGGWDNAYYLLNGSAVFLATTSSTRVLSGTESVLVSSGDTIGWRVESVDGLFGPGTMVITNFQIPGPAGLGLFAFAATVRLRRRARRRPI